MENNKIGTSWDPPWKLLQIKVSNFSLAILTLTNPMCNISNLLVSGVTLAGVISHPVHTIRVRVVQTGCSISLTLVYICGDLGVHFGNLKRGLRQYQSVPSIDNFIFILTLRFSGSIDTPIRCSVPSG